MAGIFLSRFGLLMGSTADGDGDGSGSGSSGTDVVFDAAFAGPGHTLSNDDRTLVNTGGGSDYRWWVPATKKLPGDHPVPFYWEFEANPGGPAEFNGYVAVVSQAQLDNAGRTYDSGQNPVYDGSLGYRGSGDVWGNSGTRLGSYTAYGAGDIVMMAFDPGSGGLWVGLNGVWENDPDTDMPSEISTAAGGDFWPVGQGREPDEGGTLRSLRSQFSYPVPARCIALGESLGVPDGVAASSVNGWVEIGGGDPFSVARLEEWHEAGAGHGASVAVVEAWHEIGGSEAASTSAHELWTERTIT